MRLKALSTLLAIYLLVYGFSTYRMHGHYALMGGKELAQGCTKEYSEHFIRGINTSLNFHAEGMSIAEFQTAVFEHTSAAGFHSLILQQLVSELEMPEEMQRSMDRIIATELERGLQELESGLSGRCFLANEKRYLAMQFNMLDAPENVRDITERVLTSEQVLNDPWVSFLGRVREDGKWNPLLQIQSADFLEQVEQWYPAR